MALISLLNIKDAFEETRFEYSFERHKRVIPHVGGILLRTSGAMTENALLP